MSDSEDDFYETTKNASVEWKIKKFLDQEGDDGCLRSPIFLLFDEKFSIHIYPNAKTFNLVKCVSLYLCKESSRSDIRVKYTLGLKRSIDGSVFKSYNSSRLFTMHGRGKGSRFIERSQLIQAKDLFGRNGTLTVFCEACMEDVSTNKTSVADVSTNKILSPISVPNSIETLSKDFERFYLSGCQTDVLLDVRGKKFSANRFVLSSRSSVFRAMFEADMKERITSEVNITDCDPESFGSFLRFLYSGRLDVVSSENALGLYTAADKYNVQDLKKECCECLARELSVDLICDVLLLATLHEERELLKCATTYFITNASDILRTQQWQTLLKMNPTVANELFIKVADTLRVLSVKTTS